MAKYIFKPYHDIFPRLFADEKNRLGKYLTGKYQIEHFGSTAVPGLGGKGIIDLYVIVSRQRVGKAKKEIERAGYLFRSNSGTARRLFFLQELPDAIEEKRVYHLHLTDMKNLDFQNDIRFRDYLRTHHDAVKEYAVVKRKSAQEANESKEMYMRIKQPVLQKILKKALEGRILKE